MAESLAYLRNRREQFRVEIRRKQNEALFSENRKRSLLAVKVYKQQSLEQLTDLLEKFMLQCEMPEEQLSFFEALISEIKEQVTKGNIEQIAAKLAKLDGVDALLQQASVLYSQFTKKKVQMNSVYSFKEIYQKWLEKVAGPIDQQSAGSNVIKKQNLNWNLNGYQFFAAQMYGNEMQAINALKIANSQIESGESKQILQGLRIVYNVSQNSNFTQFILTMNCIQGILNYIYIKDKRFSSLSREILFNLTSSLEVEETRKLLQLRCLDIVIYLLQQYDNYQVRQKALNILNNLVNSSMNDVLENLLSDDNYFSQLSRSLYEENLHLKVQLLNILVNFTQQCTHEQLIRMVNCTSLNLINQIIQCLQFPDQNIVLLALKCLLNIFSQTVYDNQEEFIKYLVLNNLTSLLESLALQSLNQEISSFAHVILYQYVVHEQTFFR